MSTVPKAVAAEYERSERDAGNATFTSSTLRLAVCEACGHVVKRTNKGSMGDNQRHPTIVVAFATESEPCAMCREVGKPDCYSNHTPESVQVTCYDWCQRVLTFQRTLREAYNDEVDARMKSMDKRINAFERRIEDVASRVTAATARC